MTNENVTFGFYYIDQDYIDGMRAFNDNAHVPLADYEDFGRARKFYCGPVTNEYGVNYYVPVSHETDKNMYIKGSNQNGVREYFGLITYDSMGNKAGNLDFRYLVPCHEERFLEKCKIKGHAKTQWDFCRTHEAEIKKLAHETYNNIHSNQYPALTESSINDEDATSYMWDCYDKYETLTAVESLKDKIANRALAAEQLTTNIAETNINTAFTPKL